MDAWRWRESLLLLLALQISFGHAAVGAALLTVLLVGELFAGEPRWARTPLDRALIVVTLAAAASAWTSPWPAPAWASFGFFTVGALIILRATVLATLRSATFARRFLQWWGAGGAITGVIVVATIGQGLNARAQLPGLGPNGLGTTMALALVIVLGLSSVDPGRRRVVWYAAALPVVAALILTFSRGAWLAAGVGIGVLLVSGRGHRVWQGVGVVAMAVVVSLLAQSPRWFWHTPRLLDLAERGQTLSRLAVWRVVPEMIAARPLLGSGLGTFPLAFAEATGRHPDVDPMPFAHNLVINAAVELGLAGLAALLALLGVGVAAAARWHRRRRAGPDGRIGGTVLAAVLTMLGHQMVDGTIMGVHLAIALFALLGLAAAGDVSSRRDTAGLGGQRL